MSEACISLVLKIYIFHYSCGPASVLAYHSRAAGGIPECELDPVACHPVATIALGAAGGWVLRAGTLRACVCVCS
jgi:hypothetical protein